MTRVRIDVTQDDIDNGERDSCDACPIARALHRVGYPRAEVYRASWWPGDHDRSHVPLPPSAMAFVQRFDAGREPVVPGTFVLPVLD